MKEKIHGVITFMENHVVECRLNAGCGRCDEARQHVATLKEVLKDIDAEVDRRIKERMPSPSDKLKGLREYQFSIRGRHEKDYITEDFLEGVEWLRSRLTQKTDNLKENNNNGSTN